MGEKIGIDAKSDCKNGLKSGPREKEKLLKNDRKK